MRYWQMTASPCQLLLGDHGSLLQQLFLAKAVVFNLGYLPGSDKTIASALEMRASMPFENCLMKRHPHSDHMERAGGLAESKAVENWMLEQKRLTNGWYTQLRQSMIMIVTLSVPTDLRKKAQSILWVIASLGLESLLKLNSL